MKSSVLLAATALLAACVCQQPAPAPQPQAATPPATVNAGAEASAMSKEAEQVIAVSEKSAEKETPATPSLAAPLPPGVSRCWLRGDMRTITTEQSKDGSCQVVYDSASQSHVVASKGREQAECSRLHERLKKNLIASGFKCE